MASSYNYVVIVGVVTQSIIIYLSAELESRAPNGSSVLATINTRNSEQGLEHTTKTLTGKETSGDGEHVHVKARGIPLLPDVVEDGASTHGEGVVHLGHDEGETDGILKKDIV
jgi:hypothetical protein